MELGGYTGKFCGRLNQRIFCYKKVDLYKVITCVSFTTLCYAMVCNIDDKLWDSKAMLWDLNAMLLEIEKKGLMICYAKLYYAMVFEKKYASIHQRVPNILA